MVYKQNLAEMNWAEMDRSARFSHRRKMLTPVAEAYAPKLGITLYKLQAGKRAGPYHAHSANDEAILVTKGTGTLRYGDEEIPMREGDYVHLPAASGRAHQMINTSDEDLEYFCTSSMVRPDVVIYPDSNKLAADFPTANEDGKPARRFAVMRHETVDYWDGETLE
jgi:uncharacterized cupin superfamily protein